MVYFVGALAVVLILVVIHDVFQRSHTILHNFPLIGHLRYLVESIGPELRQYIVSSNDEERPFSRDQRRWVYASSKQQNNYFGFGTDNNLEASSGYIIIKHSAFPHQPKHDEQDALFPIPANKVLGAARGRAKAFRPASVVNTSAMSFGSLSGAAVEAINRGAALADCLQNTGEGGISPHHLHGGDLIWQLGTAYFGARTDSGRLDIAMLAEQAEQHQVKAIEIKLSQGAKPGKGGVLPGAKVTPEIAKIRGIEVGVDCLSPSTHPEFSNADELLDLVETIADATGLPVGIKSAIGNDKFFVDLADLMAEGGRGVDYIQVDGGEGGTGAAPLAFSDHVALPFRLGFSRLYPIFRQRDLHESVVFIGSGKLGFPQEALLAFALGCDMIAVAREAMLSIGCIQAQRCHTGVCPAGIATQSKWLMQGLDPALKSVRFANYIASLRHDILSLSHAIGVAHPAEVGLEDIEILDGPNTITPSHQVFGYKKEWAKRSSL